MVRVGKGLAMARRVEDDEGLLNYFGNLENWVWSSFRNCCSCDGGSKCDSCCAWLGELLRVLVQSSDGLVLSTKPGCGLVVLLLIVVGVRWVSLLELRYCAG